MSAELRALVERVRETRAALRARAAEPHYGYCVVEDPHDFHPDLEANTPEEIESHREACEAWDRGERNVSPLGCGNLPRMDGWGLGAQTIHDPAAVAAVAVLDALLAHPEWVEAVEVLTALGAARATYRATGAHTCDRGDDSPCDVCQRFADSRIVASEVFDIADRLHAAKGGG